ncbi:sodium-dependent phosphate transporter [Geobacillus sp. C56-T3]|nr:sodium-dependent phosphate transporter [Geobacillus sp. C56-T3]
MLLAIALIASFFFAMNVEASGAAASIGVADESDAIPNRQAAV